MTLNIIIAQLIAIMATCLNAIGSTSTKKSNILLVNACGNGLSSAQYILLGAYTGCTACFIAIARNYIFGKYNKKNKEIPLYVLILFIAFAIVVNIPLYNTWFAIIPILNICVYGYGLWQKSIKTVKKATIFVGATGILYNIITMAYVSLLSGCIDFFGGIIGLYKANKESKLNA